MAQENKTDFEKPHTPAAKRPWVTPAIEIAEARGAEAFGGPPGGIDYGFYS